MENLHTLTPFNVTMYERVNFLVTIVILSIRYNLRAVCVESMSNMYFHYLPERSNRLFLLFVVDR